MRSIWKWNLQFRADSPTYTCDIPEGAQIVHFGMQPDLTWGGAVPTVWALVDSDSPPEPRRFQILGTGHPLPRGARHVGTYGDGPFVWHVFEMVGEPLPDGLDLPADAEAAYRTMTAGGFTLRADKAWVAPDDEPLTTEQMMAVATLQEYGFGSVVSA